MSFKHKLYFRGVFKQLGSLPRIIAFSLFTLLLCRPVSTCASAGIYKSDLVFVFQYFCPPPNLTRISSWRFDDTCAMKYYIKDFVQTHDNIVDEFGQSSHIELVTKARSLNLIIVLSVFLEPACQHWMQKDLMIVEADEYYVFIQSLDIQLAPVQHQHLLSLTFSWELDGFVCR